MTYGGDKILFLEGGKVWGTFFDSNTRPDRSPPQGLPAPHGPSSRRSARTSEGAVSEEGGRMSESSQNYFIIIKLFFLLFLIFFFIVFYYYVH